MLAKNNSRTPLRKLQGFVRRFLAIMYHFATLVMSNYLTPVPSPNGEADTYATKKCDFSTGTAWQRHCGCQPTIKKVPGLITGLVRLGTFAPNRATKLQKKSK